VDRVARVVPAVDGLDRVRVRLRGGDRLVSVGVLDAREQLVVAQAMGRVGELLLIGQLDAEAAPRRGGDQRPVVV
jgi:hypothetical protein